jgi:hypothetical protein
MSLNRRFMATFGIFIALHTSSLAKCPNNFVEIRGHVRCTVHRGDKVLATLIFTEHQAEASAPETALDVQERASC